MKIIHKHELWLTNQDIQTFEGAKVLSVQYRYGKCFVWLEVNKSNPPALVRIYQVGTGHEVIEDTWQYVCTVQYDLFVWHFYAEWGQ